MNYITGTIGNDTLTGTTSDDVLVGDFGDDLIIGAGGIDTALYFDNAMDYRIVRYDNYATIADYAVNNGDEGIDILQGIEWLEFADKKLRVTERLLIGDNAAIVYETSSPNNTYSQAQLVNLSNTNNQGWIHGTISNSSDRDAYRIDVTNFSDIEISLEGQGSHNLSMRLWQDTNGNGIFESGEWHTNYKSNGGIEYLFKPNRTPGAHYIEVWRTSGANNANYQLGVALNPNAAGSSALPMYARDLGSLNGTLVATENIGHYDNEDLFKFMVTENSNLFVDLTFADSYGAAGMELFDATGAIVATANTNNINETISYLAQAGTYYLKVFDELGYSQNYYNLQMQSIPLG